MIPIDLKDFIIAIVGASASFIGLLFVAISLTFNEAEKSSVKLTTERILAESSYAALLNIFFIGLVALIPGANIGYVMLVMALAGVGNALHYSNLETKIPHNKPIVGLSFALYIIEGLYGLDVILTNRHHAINQYGLMTLILFLFATALTRAWELTGIREEPPHKNS